MPSRSYVLSFVLLFLVPVILLISPVASSSQVVSEIQVEGNENWSRDRILLGFGVVIGEELSVESVRDGIRRLYDMGRFSDVQVYVDEKDDGSLALIVAVVERPLIKSLRITGNDKVGDSDIESKIRIREDGPYDTSAVEESRTGIIKLYEEKGFPSSSVEAIVREKDGNTVTVEFSVEEGVRIAVKEISFVGNEAIEDSELTKVMETKEDRWWRTDAFYDTEVLEADFEKIVERYREEGYIDARVVGYDTTFDELGEKASISIEVGEGSLYHVTAVEWQGASGFAEESLYDLAALEIGEVYVPTDADQTIRDAYSWYGERGYIHARIYKREDIEPDNTIRLVFVVDEAEPAHVGEIHIVGNKRTKEKVIRRQLTVMPGDLYQTSEVILSQRRVANLGFFDGPFVDFSESGTPGDIDLIFSVEERSTGRAGVGMSHTSERGVTGFIDVRQENLLGNGQFLDFKWEFNKDNSDFVIGFTEPWFLDREFSLGFDLYDITRRQDSDILYTFYDPLETADSDTARGRSIAYDRDRERRGGDVKLGMPFFGSKNSKVWLQYTVAHEKLEEYETIVIDTLYGSGGTSAPDTVRAYYSDPAWKWRTGLTATLIRRTTDRRFHPRTGSYTKFTADLFGGPFPGNVDYQRYVLEARKYVPGFWTSTLLLRARAGVVTGYGDPSTIPSDTKFELGGVGLYGIRGYRDRSILPAGVSYPSWYNFEHVGGTGDPGSPWWTPGTYESGILGGRSMLVLTSELEFPIVEGNFPIYGIFFMDAGNTWNSVGDARPLDLVVGAGAGIRIEVPVLGSIGVDMGYGFDEEKGGEWIAHYQFGIDYW